MAISGKQSWIEDSDVFSLFPTLVWKTQLRAEVHEAIDASALGLLRSLRQGLPELKSGEAWQSGHALHRRGGVGGPLDPRTPPPARRPPVPKIPPRAGASTRRCAHLLPPAAARPPPNP